MTKYKYKYIYIFKNMYYHKITISYSYFQIIQRKKSHMHFLFSCSDQSSCHTHTHTSSHTCTQQQRNKGYSPTQPCNLSRVTKPASFRHKTYADLISDNFLFFKQTMQTDGLTAGLQPQASASVIIHMNQFIKALCCEASHWCRSALCNSRLI